VNSILVNNTNTSTLRFQIGSNVLFPVNITAGSGIQPVPHGRGRATITRHDRFRTKLLVVPAASSSTPAPA